MVLEAIALLVLCDFEELRNFNLELLVLRSLEASLEVSKGRKASSKADLLELCSFWGNFIIFLVEVFLVSLAGLLKAAGHYGRRLLYKGGLQAWIWSRLNGEPFMTKFAWFWVCKIWSNWRNFTNLLMKLFSSLDTCKKTQSFFYAKKKKWGMWIQKMLLEEDEMVSKHYTASGLNSLMGIQLSHLPCSSSTSIND